MHYTQKTDYSCLVLPSLTPLSDRCYICGCTRVLMISAFLFSALIHKKWESQSIVSLFSPLAGSDTVKKERARMSMHTAFAENHPTGHQQKWQNSALQLSLVWTHKQVHSEFLYCVSDQYVFGKALLVCTLCFHPLFAFFIVLQRTCAFHLHPLVFVALPSLWHFSFFKKTVRRHISHTMGCSVRWYMCIWEKREEESMCLCVVFLFCLSVQMDVSIYSPFCSL